MPAQGNQLSDVESVVIRELNGLAEQRLAVSVCEGREEVRLWIGHQRPHGSKIAVEGFYAFVPRLSSWRLGTLRPVCRRPLRRCVFRVAAEFEHVPLSYTQVLEHFPDAVWGTLGADASQICRKARYSGVKIGVCAFALKDAIEFVAQGLNLVHAPYHRLSVWLTIPNLLTLVRILLTPFIVFELSRGNYMTGGWTFGGAAFTDVLDGFLARRLGDHSKIGQYFDPIADKVLLSSIYIGLALARAVPLWIVLLIFARDLWILALSGIALRFTRFRQLQPSVWGKASTFFQIMAAVGVMAARAYENAWFLRISNVLLAGVVALAAISALDYTMRGVLWLRAASQRR